MKKKLLYVFADQWQYHTRGITKEDSVYTPHMDAFSTKYQASIASFLQQSLSQQD